MDKVFGYVRVSTSNQAKDGYSLLFQFDEIRKYASANSFDLLHVYEDKGISGAKADEEEMTVNRDGLQAMFSDLRGNGVRYIIVLNTSRLWRSDLTKILIHRELKRTETDIKSLEQPNYSIYTADPTDILVNGMMELLDEYQRLEIALKMGRGRRKKAEQGGYAGGGVVFGYKVKKSDKAIQVNDEQAIIVRMVFAIREEHPAASLSKIADIINSKGCRTAQGKVFTKVQIKRILDHRDFYRGIYQYGQIEVKGEHAAII